MRSTPQTTRLPTCSNVSFVLLLLVTYSSFLPAAVSANHHHHHGGSSHNNPQPTTNTLPRSSPSIPRTDPHSTEARRRQRSTIVSSSSSSSTSTSDSTSSTLIDAPPAAAAAALPWNPSPHIDADGFLRPWYFRIPGEWEAPELILSLAEYQQLLHETARVRRDPSHGSNQPQRPKLIRGGLSSGGGGWWESAGGNRPRTLSTTSSSTTSAATASHSDSSSSSSAYHNYHQLCTVPVRIRQVPGDGNCLFHSISLCLRHAVNGTHWNMMSHDEAALDDLYQHSRWLRQQAVQCLRQSHRRLVLQGRETLKAHELVHAAAQQYALTTEEYCAAMEQEFVWGGRLCPV